MQAKAESKATLEKLHARDLTTRRRKGGRRLLAKLDAAWQAGPLWAFVFIARSRASKGRDAATLKLSLSEQQDRAAHVL